MNIAHYMMQSEGCTS